MADSEDSADFLCGFCPKTIGTYFKKTLQCFPGNITVFSWKHHSVFPETLQCFFKIHQFPILQYNINPQITFRIDFGTMLMARL